MVIIERDGESFEVCLAELPEADPVQVEAAGRIFGHLTVISTEPDSLLPRQSSAPTGCYTKFSLDTFLPQH